MIDLSFLEREMSMAKICDAERVQEQESEKLNLKFTSLFVCGSVCDSVCGSMHAKRGFCAVDTAVYAKFSA